ncbi:hypothetical protein ACFQ1I_10295 [Kitasatospora arboriphila]
MPEIRPARRRSTTRGVPGARRFAALCGAAALALPMLVTAAAPAAAAGPTAVVSMGDSYVSGEAGRWDGNSDTASGGRDGTDRAWTGSGYDPARVYGSTYTSGCDRSDSAEVRSASGVAQTQINLACSGATSANVFRAANGGQSFKGEAPQADQLAAVAAQNTVKLITLSVGGNDLGFGDVISTCVQDYEIWWSYCHDDQQAAVDAKMDAAMAGVGKAVDEVRAVMSAAATRPPRTGWCCSPTRRRSRAAARTATRRAAGAAPTPAAARSGTSTPTGPGTRSSRRSPTGWPPSPPPRACSSSTCGTSCRAARSARPRPGWRLPAPRRRRPPASGPASSTWAPPPRAPCRSPSTRTTTRSWPSAAA